MNLSAAFAAAAGAFVAAWSADAQDVIGNFDAWTAFTEGQGGSKICYMASQPTKEEGDYNQRGDTFVLVTHRPGENTRDTVEVRAGYSYKSDSEVTLNIDGKDYALFTNGESAWARDQKTDTQLAQNMMKGNRLVIRGTSSRGTLTTDTYSLIGFTAAYRAIGEACGVK